MAFFSRHGSKKKRSTSDVSHINAPVNKLVDEKEDISVKKSEVNAEIKNHVVIKNILEDPISDNICMVSKRCKGMIPEWLKIGSNSKAWSQLIDEMNRSKLQPILLHGPTGCGKSRGVKDCATACNLRVYEIEPSSLDSTENLKKWVSNIVSSRTLLGPRTLIIDVVEGLDESFIKVFEEILTKTLSFQIPMIFIADSLYYYPLKKLCSLIPTKIRLFLQCPETCVQFAKMTFAKNIQKEVIEDFADKCNGNLRILKNNIKLLNEYSGKFTGSYSDQSLSLFKSTCDMLTGHLQIEKWTMASEHSSLKRLLWDNYLNLTNDFIKISEFAFMMSAERVEDPLGIHIFLCGLQYKSLHNTTNSIPKMTLTSDIRPNKKSNIKNHDDFMLRSYSLDIPLHLLHHQTYDTD